jgi:hypothetical protein
VIRIAVGGLTATIVGPANEASKYVLRPLEPLQADDSGGPRLRVALSYCCVGKNIDLLTRHCRLYCLGSPIFGYAAPWIRHVLIKGIGIESMHNFPCSGTEADKLLTLPRAPAVRTINNSFVNFVGGYRSDSLDHPITDSVALLRNHVRDEQHGTLVIGTRSLRYFFKICFSLLVFAEQPIDCTVSSNSRYRFAAFSFAPFIEERVECGGPPAFPVRATCYRIVVPNGSLGIEQPSARYFVGTLK